MRKLYTLLFLVIAVSLLTFSFSSTGTSNNYIRDYNARLSAFATGQQQLLQIIQQSNINSPKGKQVVRQAISQARFKMKALDFWFRYLEPVAYKKVNGPLPVEWETEVFEKFEKPYKREGAGLSLAEMYLDEDHLVKDTLLNLVKASLTACDTYAADSITSQLNNYQYFFLCNRLFLLNLAAVYTTGFECPDTSNVVPELIDLLRTTSAIYQDYNQSFDKNPLPDPYLQLYERTVQFAEKQSKSFSRFDHFTFIQQYVNPLFALNQQYIRQYRIYSKSFVDYSLNKNSASIFSKQLYNGQNPKGIFLRVDDSAALAELNHIGKLLFYDPILSGNNQRSCNSCHKGTEYFTDTAFSTSMEFNHAKRLERNSISLINAQFNHLIMLDGKHISLQNQLQDVMTNPHEMGSSDSAVLQKVMSCDQYKKAFAKFLTYTPQEPEVTIEHIAAAITIYYTRFSNYYSPFDDAMNDGKPLSAEAKQGFNLFMSKAKCGTCHFVPHFNGIKPPYVSSEFEVLGVPANKKYTKLSPDKGRYLLNNAPETMNAIRTGSIRNAQYTKPYMHNGVFTTLEEVIDFYDGGGGVGHGLKVSNQTLPAEPLHLTKNEKKQLISFIKSLNEKIEFETPPASLPVSATAALNKRKVGGTY